MSRRRYLSYLYHSVRLTPSNGFDSSINISAKPSTHAILFGNLRLYHRQTMYYLISREDIASSASRTVLNYPFRFHVHAGSTGAKLADLS